MSVKTETTFPQPRRVKDSSILQSKGARNGCTNLHGVSVMFNHVPDRLRAISSGLLFLYSASWPQRAVVTTLPRSQLPNAAVAPTDAQVGPCMGEHLPAAGGCNRLVQRTALS